MGIPRHDVRLETIAVTFLCASLLTFAWMAGVSRPCETARPPWAVRETSTVTQINRSLDQATGSTRQHRIHETTAGDGGPSGSGFERAIASATPRVVKLYGLGAGLQAGYGSGVIVAPDGLVLTVLSLLIDARRIRAVTADGKTYQARVVYRDRQRQLALLQLMPFDVAPNEPPPTGEDHHATGEGVGPFSFFDLRREATLAPGDWVVAAGNAFKVADGAEPVSIAHGVFSIRTRLDARRRLNDYPYRGDVLVIDAITSNPGAPGSAVVNLDGEFVGMIGRVVVSNLTHTHFNFAMPRDVLEEFVDQASAPPQTRDAMINSKREEEPFDPGIRLSRFGYRTVLPFVERVLPGSAAKRAGIRKDDLILSVNGRSVTDATTYQDRIRRLTSTEPIDLVIRRGRSIVTVRIAPDKPELNHQTTEPHPDPSSLPEKKAPEQP